MSTKKKPPYDVNNMILRNRWEAVLRERRKIVRRKKKKNSAAILIESSRSQITEAAFLKFRDGVL